MPPEGPPRKPGHLCAHPDCCGHEAAGGVSAVGNPAGASPAEPQPEAAPRLGPLKRWLLWFLAFFGIYASSSVCPFCGAPGCPVGIGGAAVVAAVFAGLWQYGKSAWEKLTGLIAGRSR